MGKIEPVDFAQPAFLDQAKHKTIEFASNVEPGFGIVSSCKNFFVFALLRLSHIHTA